jgi:tRNA-specific 2-thiouridylase
MTRAANQRPDLAKSPADTRVVVAMSGGVDSSVVAGLLVEQGFDVVGITMHLSDVPAEFLEEEQQGTCCAPDDVRDARRVAAHLAIPHYVANYKKAFKEKVIDRFVADYQAGRTPSPCVRCNDDLKFSVLLERATALGADYLATGHYARIVPTDDGSALYRAVDLQKDQSYFLFGASGRALEKVLFPLGDMTKEEVRGHAERLGLPVAHKPESQDICFVPDGDYAGFVERHSTPIKGDVVDEKGELLGRHEGIHQFTIGQRRGLGLPGGTPKRFVIGISAGDGRIVVGHSDALLAKGLEAENCRWTNGTPPGSGTPVLARVRHRSTPVSAVVERAGDELNLMFTDPQRAVAPGQAVVLYDAQDAEKVLGGGWIERALPADVALSAGAPA